MSLVVTRLGAWRLHHSDIHISIEPQTIIIGSQHPLDGASAPWPVVPITQLYNRTHQAITSYRTNESMGLQTTFVYIQAKLGQRTSWRWCVGWHRPLDRRIEIKDRRSEYVTSESWRFLIILNLQKWAGEGKCVSLAPEHREWETKSGAPAYQAVVLTTIHTHFSRSDMRSATNKTYNLFGFLYAMYNTILITSCSPLGTWRCCDVG